MGTSTPEWPFITSTLMAEERIVVSCDTRDLKSLFDSSMFGAFRASHVNQGGLLWSVPLRNVLSGIHLTQENAMEAVAYPQSQCSLQTQKSGRGD